MKKGALRPSLLKATFFPFAAGLFAFAIHLPYVWIDFDPHHDGLMLAQLVAFLEGRGVHSGFFSMYGPVTTVSQAVFHLALGLDPTIVSLRLWAAAHVAGATSLVALLGSVAPASWQLRKSHSLGAALVWASTSSVLSQGHFMPWPTLLSGFTVALIAVCLSISMSKLSFSGLRVAVPFLILAGTLSGILPFIRLNHGGAVIFGILLTLAVTLILRINRLSIAVSIIAGTMVMSIVAILGILWASGSLGAFFFQSVVVPLSWGEVGLAQWNTFSSLGSVFVDVMFGLLGFLILFFLLLKLVEFSERKKLLNLRLSKSRFYLVTALVVGGAWLYATESFIPLLNILYRPSISNFRQGLDSAFSLEGELVLLYTILFLSLVATVALAAETLRGTLAASVAQREVKIGILILLGISATGFSQVIPTWDVHHVWWGSTLASIPLVLGLQRMGVFSSDFTRAVSGGVVGLLALSGSYTSVNAGSELLAGWESSVEAHAVSPLVPSSVILSEGRREELDNINRLLSQIPKGTASIDFLVADGYLAVATGTYRDDDEWFVRWDLFESTRPITSSEFVVVDSWLFFSPGESFRSDSIEDLDGYRQLMCSGRYCALHRQ